LFTCGFDRVTLGWSVQARDVVDQHSPRSQVTTAGGSEVGGNDASGGGERLSLSLKSAKEFAVLKEQSSREG